MKNDNEKKWKKNGEKQSMKKQFIRKKNGIMYGVLILLFILTLATTYSIGNNGTIVSIPDCDVLQGETLFIPINISNVANIITADIKLSFNGSIVNILSVDNSDFDSMIPTIDNTNGWLRIGAFQIMSPELSGDITLGILLLQAVGDPGETSLLQFTDVYLENDTETEIIASADNGTFTIASNEPPDTTPPTITNIQATPNPQTPTNPLTITCDITDNTAVHTATLHLTYPDTTSTTHTLTPTTTPHYSHTTTYTQPGTYTYYIWANDTHNNHNTTPTHTFTIRLLKPASEVQNISPNKYHLVSLPLIVNVDVTEFGTGIKQVELYYRYRPNGGDWEDWILYEIKTTHEQYSLMFYAPNGTGHYELYSIAISNNNIEEDIPTVADTNFSVYPIWDVNMDGQINILDVICIAKYWGENTNGYRIPEDANNDGIVNILDLILLGQHWGD